MNLLVFLTPLLTSLVVTDVHGMINLYVVLIVSIVFSSLQMQLLKYRQTLIRLLEFSNKEDSTFQQIFRIAD